MPAAPAAPSAQPSQPPAAGTTSPAPAPAGSSGAGGNSYGTVASKLLTGAGVAVVALPSYALGMLALAVWPPLTLLLWAATYPFDRDRVVTSRFYRLLPAFWSRCFPLWRIRFEGEWPAAGGPYLIVANHQSFLDIFVLCGIPREWKWVAKRSLFRIPMFGWGFSLTGSVSLARGDTASALAAMAKCRHYLAQGISVMIFPEGTRSADGTVLPFLPGAFKLAVESGVPVLPIAITGTGRGLPKGSWRVRPSNITVRILEPVPTATLTGRDVRKLRDAVRGSIAAAVEREAP